MAFGVAETWAAAGKRSPSCRVAFTAWALDIPAASASQYTDLPDFAYCSGVILAAATGGAVHAFAESRPVAARPTREPGSPADLTATPSAPFAHEVATSPPRTGVSRTSVIAMLPAARAMREVPAGAASAFPAGAAIRADTQAAEPA